MLCVSKRDFFRDHFTRIAKLKLHAPTFRNPCTAFIALFCQNMLAVQLSLILIFKKQYRQSGSRTGNGLKAAASFF